MVVLHEGVHQYYLECAIELQEGTEHVDFAPGAALENPAARVFEWEEYIV